MPIGAAAVEIAKRYIGTPYSWGGGTDEGPSRGFDQGANTVGFDCSSLMKYAYAQLGVKIPRVTYDQVNAGVEVPRSQLQPGDLILFAHGGDVHHVGMYVGDNKFIHAPHTGDVVKISSLDDPYYDEQYHVARRVATGVVPRGRAVRRPSRRRPRSWPPASRRPRRCPRPGALPAPGGVTPAAGARRWRRRRNAVPAAPARLGAERRVRGRPGPPEQPAVRRHVLELRPVVRTRRRSPARPLRAPRCRWIPHGAADRRRTRTRATTRASRRWRSGSPARRRRPGCRRSCR